MNRSTRETTKIRSGCAKQVGQETRVEIGPTNPIDEILAGRHLAPHRRDKTDGRRARQHYRARRQNPCGRVRDSLFVCKLPRLLGYLSVELSDISERNPWDLTAPPLWMISARRMPAFETSTTRQWSPSPVSWGNGATTTNREGRDTVKNCHCRQTGLVTAILRAACQRVRRLPGCLSSTKPWDFRNAISSRAAICGNRGTRALRRSTPRRAPASRSAGWAGRGPGETGGVARWRRVCSPWPLPRSSHC